MVPTGNYSTHSVVNMIPTPTPNLYNGKYILYLLYFDISIFVASLAGSCGCCLPVCCHGEPLTFTLLQALIVAPSPPQGHPIPHPPTFLLLTLTLDLGNGGVGEGLSPVGGWRGVLITTVTARSGLTVISYH